MDANWNKIQLIEAVHLFERNREVDFSEEAVRQLDQLSQFALRCQALRTIPAEELAKSVAGLHEEAKSHVEAALRALDALEISERNLETLCKLSRPIHFYTMFMLVFSNRSREQFPLARHAIASLGNIVQAERSLPGGENPAYLSNITDRYRDMERYLEYSERRAVGPTRSIADLVSASPDQKVSELEDDRTGRAR